MINCKNCGAPLSIDDVKCPHCGTINEEAIFHAQKLQELEKDFSKTKKQVIQEVKKSSKGYNLLVILVVLLIANIVVFLLYMGEYELAESIVNSSRNYKEENRIMETYLQNEDYIGFGVYTDRLSDFNYDMQRKYSSIDSLVYDYRYVLKNLFYSLYAKEPYDDPLTRTAESIVRFNESYQSFINRHNNYPETLKDAENMCESINSYLMAFMNLSKEDVLSLSDMKSSSEIIVLLKERMTNEEN